MPAGYNRGMPATRFLSVSDMRALLTEVGVTGAIRGTLAQMEADFRRWNDFEKCPRTANHSPVGVIELMPVSDKDEFSFKYVNGHPTNFQFDLMTVMAFGVLAKMETGFPVLLSEMTLLTAVRTAAASVMAAKVLARKDSRSMAMIGNGAQAEFQILAFHDLLGINRVHLFDTDPDATRKLQANLSGVAGLELIAFESTAEAVRGVDIITTCTADKTLATILTQDMIEPGMHLNAIGGDCPGKTELETAIVPQCRVVVEFAPQSRIEGEIQHMPADFPVTELWEILTGKSPGRTSETEVTLFDSVGFALEDYSALKYVYAVATQRGIGSEIELMPTLSNVKDLFGLLQVASSAKR